MTDLADAVRDDPRTAAPPVSLPGAIGLVVAAVFQILPVTPLLAQASDAAPFLLLQFVSWLVGAVILLASGVLLAVGPRGTAGIAGRSAAGRIALIVACATGLVEVAGIVVGFSVEPGTAAMAAVPIVQQAIAIAAATLAAIAVLRARVLDGFARRVLLLVAAADAAALVLLLVDAALGYLVTLYAVRPALLAVAGVAFLLQRAGARRAAA